jgi:hypothetical protein
VNAQPRSDAHGAQQPTTEIDAYFTAERRGGFLLVAMAIAGFALAAFLWRTQSAFMAMAWPLVILGVIEVIIGLVIALRTPGQVAALEEGLRRSPAATVSGESRRMSTINRNFRIIKVVEVAVLALGLLLAVLLPSPSAWAAVGIGLLAEATLLLAFDTFAHHRAEVYTQWLQTR